MAREEITFQNFAGGLLGEDLYGRYDLAAYRNGCRRLENYIVETPGACRYRTGLNFVNHTRLNQVANLIKFEFNDLQAYVLEFTDKKLRFYRNDGFITEATKTITGITQANPGVVTTSAAHGFANGDEIFISGVVGMTEVNGKTFLAANVAATTFELTDIDSNNVDTTSFTAYGSAGTAARVYEIDTPYTEANDLFSLEVTQNADTMYIVHPFYEPRKLTRTDHTAWTLSRFTRTGTDHFLVEEVITGITQADPGVVTVVGHSFTDGDTVIIEEVTGMTEVNSQPYLVANSAANTFELNDLDGNTVDTTGFTAYAALGFASNQDLLPGAVSFYESRLFYGGSEGFPERFYGSRSPDGTGVPRYDDFTGGTSADNAVEFAIADAEVNKILFLEGTDRLLLAGTFGSEVKITGTTSDQAITPTSVSARPLGRVGVQDVSPINKFNNIMYVERGGLIVKNFALEPISETFTSEDITLVSRDVTESGVKQLAYQRGRPDILWAIRNDGKLAGLTFEPREQVKAWHLHTTGATKEDSFLSVATIPRPSNIDQTWVVSKRVVDSNTRRYVEFFADTPAIPVEKDFFTGTANKVADLAKFKLAIAEAQKGYIHVDSALTYDGTAPGSSASATMTPGALTGNTITFTAGASVFIASDVGRQIWKKAIDGVGTGRATIVTFNSGTEVVCNIIDDFDDTDAIPAGSWYLTTGTITGLDHLEGRTVSVCTDGKVHPDETVSSGAITLDFQASKVHVGLAYEGFLQPMSLEFGGATGPSQTKNKHVREVGVRFLKSFGSEVGTDIYDPTIVRLTTTPILVGDPQPLFTGIIKIPINEEWEEDKLVYVRQDLPLPSIVQLLAIYGETDDN